MSYRTILVYLDNQLRAPAVLSVATQLAEQHGAHLIGLYVVPPLELYVTTEVPIPLELTQNHLAYHDGIAGSLQAMFESATTNQEYVAEWRKLIPASVTVADTVAELAHTVDLVVLGQKNADADRNSKSELPERVLLGASRPVIVVPEERKFKTIGQEVFVAWNGSAEATRAVFDALPLLCKAESVSLHIINPSWYDRHHVLGTPAELVNTLSRHGVNATLSQSDAGSGEVGDELLNYARDKGADLIVMGVYGHSRFRESLFGGTSRKILREMAVPVLMSH